MSPVQSGSLPQIDRLLCHVSGFYPAEVEVKWFKNGQEETERVVSTEVMQNGDWTYQVLVLLETSPRRGDTYLCQVEHGSLQHPLSQRWGKCLPCPGAPASPLRAPSGTARGTVLSRRCRPRRGAVGRRARQDADGGGGLRAGAPLPGAGALPLPAQEGEWGAGLGWSGARLGWGIPGGSLVAGRGLRCCPTGTEPVSLRGCGRPVPPWRCPPLLVSPQGS